MAEFNIVAYLMKLKELDPKGTTLKLAGDSFFMAANRELFDSLDKEVVE